MIHKLNLFLLVFFMLILYKLIKRVLKNLLCWVYLLLLQLQLFDHFFFIRFLFQSTHRHSLLAERPSQLLKPQSLPFQKLISHYLDLFLQPKTNQSLSCRTLHLPLLVMMNHQVFQPWEQLRLFRLYFEPSVLTRPVRFLRWGFLVRSLVSLFKVFHKDFIKRELFCVQTESFEFWEVEEAGNLLPEKV